MIHDNFLLTTETAKKLYHSYAKDLPIVDYHNHLSAKDIYEDRDYESITDVWLAGDHYKWRAMRANGVEEHYITGDATNEEKFSAWADTVPNLLGNPLYHWTHLELARFFSVNDLLNKQTKKSIYKKTNEVIQSGQLSARKILDMQKVVFVGTTDDPTDNLNYHRKLKEEGYKVTVSPSFRPDKALAIDQDGFLKWLKSLEKVVDKELKGYQSFLEAMRERVDFFAEVGCRSADHGINEMFYRETSIEEIESIYKSKLNGQVLSDEQVEKFKTFTLQQLAEKYVEKQWVMQLHIGPLRNNNTRMFDQIGPDSGFDQMGDAPVAKPLSLFLDSLDQKQHLPRTILYTLNPRDNVIMASMAGNFQGADVPGKIQFGTAWWFNDHYDGMLDQMKTLASIGLLKHFVGMLTDSRSMLSFTRHELFRRILCELLGTWVEEGKVPNDEDLLAEYVKDICYYNAKRYFSL
ncbi:glucuronate isomerase [Salipaludibacillus sp. HK11]|uniref:glucuronate isomerase n=1 Tax=Salipaludibacillus sp. HK11 TaxID=3394320 RepID=UPI0039FBBA5B